MRARWFAISCLFLLGCSAGEVGHEVCDQARRHVETCTQGTLTLTICDPDAAQRLLDTTCDELEARRGSQSFLNVLCLLFPDLCSGFQPPGQGPQNPGSPQPPGPGTNPAPPPPPGSYVVPPIASCQTGSTCNLPPDSGIYAGYRKDRYLQAYTENKPAPTSGGRFHIATVAKVSGTIKAVKIDGVDLQKALEDPNVKNEQNPAEWFHVWPDPTVAGRPLWVAFHSRRAAWDSKASGQLVIETDKGVAASGSFPVQQTKVPLTYVTTTEDLKTLLIHARNTDPAPRTLKRLVVNGRDVTQAACIPKKSIPPRTSVMWRVPLCQKAKPGDAWTVVAGYHDAHPAVGAGRVLRPFFPIEAWNNTSECPFPGGNAQNYQTFTGAGLDTTYVHGGIVSKCNVDAFKLLNDVLPKTGGLHALAADDLGTQNTFTNTTAIAGFMTGDESDKAVYDKGTGKPLAWQKAKKSTELWAKYPEIPTYNGAMTNRLIGTFAGMADIQGIDYYVAACAPHITQVFSKFEITGAYDYLRNARDNHMPLPTWLYSQGLHEGWNTKHPLFGHTIHVQPDPQELLVQGMSVVAAGGKGLMWFQIAEKEIKHSPARWQAISTVSWMVRGVRRHLRAGDITGMAQAPAGALVEMIRAPDALVVVVINTRVAKKVDDTCNALKYVSESSVPHWVLAPHSPTVTVTVPADFGVAELFEVRGRQIVSPLPYGTQINGRQLAIQNVSLDNQTPVRLFVLAGNAQVRAQVAKDLNP
jgi:hypothetical protein